MTKGVDALFSGAISTFNQQISDFQRHERNFRQSDGAGDTDAIEDRGDGNPTTSATNVILAMKVTNLTVISLKKRLIFIVSRYCSHPKLLTVSFPYSQYQLRTATMATKRTAMTMTVNMRTETREMRILKRAE
jgi:hypothetical protein